MSGQDAIKGFIYQTLVTVLDSLQNDWRTILIEPKGFDKIDVIWTNLDGSETIWQIKSSQNSFEKPDVLDWILELYNSHNSAKEYKVILIGPVNQPTTEFFNRIENKEIGEFNGRHKILFDIKEKIKVNVHSRDEKVMIEAIITQILRFLESKQKSGNTLLGELIAKALLFDFLSLSSIGKVLTKDLFELELLKWIKGRFPQIDNLSLAFYLTNKIPFTESISFTRISDITNQEYVISKKKNLFNLIEKIEGYSIPGNNAITSYSFLSFNQLVGEYEEKMIRCGALKYLNRELNDSFFNFGRLEESSSFSSFTLSNKTEYLGTDDEKVKMVFFLNFELRLKNLHDLFRFWKKMQQFYFLPIVLKNEGNTYQKGLTIKIILPTNVKIIKPSGFPSPKENDIIKELNQEESVFIQYYKHFKDRYVSECPIKKRLSGNFKERLDIERNIKLNLFDETELQKERFYEQLEYFYDFQILEYDDQNVIECNIDELNANEAISLPSFIFFKANENFVIEYEINSNNLPQKVFGVLNVKSE